MENREAYNSLLKEFKDVSESEREKGTSFENLVKIFLENDSVYSPQFRKVYTYAEWAIKYGLPQVDAGIDLVAENKDDDCYTAIQCKFYNEKSVLTKKDLDSFIANSDRKEINRRIFVDTTINGLSENLENQIKESGKKFSRIDNEKFISSSINWSVYLKKRTVEQKSKKTLYAHQKEALVAVKNGLLKADTNRGKLIMACGTGKTMTSLKISEDLVGRGKSILYLVPSLALMSQTISEWAKEMAIDSNIYAVCSDVQVGKNKANNDDLADISKHDLAYPATTDAKKLADKFKLVSDKMTVIFATYQSLNVIIDAQNNYNIPSFELVICDEAHRTAGVTRKNDATSSFNKVHSQKYIKANKRLYMTATPKIYNTQVKKEAKDEDILLYSMDNMSIFGNELYVLNFGSAVEKGLLSDYKVIILEVSKEVISQDIQQCFKNSTELELNDAAKMIGCYMALSKQGVNFNSQYTDGSSKRSNNSIDISPMTPMKRAIAFCENIKKSKLFSDQLPIIIDSYNKRFDNNSNKLVCNLEHVDGTMNATIRNNKLNFLKQNINDGECHILTNARCLSEGVDVPALDAIIFLHPKKSIIDIVQSVGRVMRKHDDKKFGYVILPVFIPSGIDIHESLKHHPHYKIVWGVINALRSHDTRFESEINRIKYDEFPERISYLPASKMEVIAEVDKLPSANNAPNLDVGKSVNSSSQEGITANSLQLFNFIAEDQPFYAKIYESCGERNYWENWAKNISTVVIDIITRINSIIEDENSEEFKAVDNFLQGLRKNINSSISKEEVVEMLTQHIITKPIFNSLFGSNDFTKNNPLSIAIQKVIDVLGKYNLDNEINYLKNFYKSVESQIGDVKTAKARQGIIIELYDKFFTTAFPKVAERLGIVYTPVECVDFIIHSVKDVLKSEFNQALGDKNVHIIDPFTGTGTFITRLIQSGILSNEQLKYKYSNDTKTKTELHANEIILLAYYIATINIESAYQEKMGNKDGYIPFQGTCLTDTFQLYENEENLITSLLPANSERINIQKNLDIKVIIGNPPYSAGQTNSNDNNPNVKYPKLDNSINDKYVNPSLHKGLKNSLYDSYIRAIRWASDRIGDTGVIGFITNAGWLDSVSADGLRNSLHQEFTNIYIFHLRGNARTNGELRRKENENIFQDASRSPIAISILVKNPASTTTGNIYFHDIGDYLKRDKKLDIISNFASINGITKANKWQELKQDKFFDWQNHRDVSFNKHIYIGNKQYKTALSIFANYTNGLKTNRDAWVYNSSKIKLATNVNKMINFYNLELKRYLQALANNNNIVIKDFVTYDICNISWGLELFNYFQKQKILFFHSNHITISLYRPFNKSYVYFNRQWSNSVFQMPKIFPENSLKNIVIAVTGKSTKEFSVLISNVLPDQHFLPGGCQCFPLRLYQPVKEEEGLKDIFANESNNIITAASGKKYIVSDGITDKGFQHFTNFYNDSSISKEDLFYYIYGILNAPDYKRRFANNLSKDLPNIPRVKTLSDFKIFSKAGKDLADLHLNYENKASYPVNYKCGNLAVEMMPDKDFYVKKMKFAKKGDKSEIIYNHNITITGIPLKAYEYIVNTKSAIEWVMDRQKVSIHKDSNIKNDPNDWASEHKNNPKYPLELLLKVITISVDTVDIVNSLPKLDIMDN